MGGWIKKQVVIASAGLLGCSSLSACAPMDSADDAEQGEDSADADLADKGLCSGLSGQERKDCQDGKRDCSKLSTREERNACRDALGGGGGGSNGGGSNGDVDGPCPTEDDYHWAKNLWPDPKHIPVCFLDDVDPSDYQPIQDVVTQQYGRAGLGFTGWGKCGADDTCSMSVSTHVKKFGLSGVGSYCHPAGRYVVSFPVSGQADIIYYALHEFGHALGMNGDFNQKPCNSVMCKWYQEDDFGGVLTKCDIATIQKAYGL